MLLKVKSSFILKKIFLNIDIKRKLCILIYNKRLEKKLNINIVDYRRLSGKYKIEKNDKVKIIFKYFITSIIIIISPFSIPLFTI